MTSLPNGPASRSSSAASGPGDVDTHGGPERLERLERLEREKRELQQALAILVGAAARAYAQGGPHDRRGGALRELAEATDAARATLDGTR